jgi:methionine-rich copper-binding protein CopC
MADVLRRLALILISLVLVPSSAAAHSNSVDTNPEDGATLETMPAEATVTFNEAPKTASVVLARPDGQIDKLTTDVAGSTIRVRLPADGPPGVYTLSYRVVSADGHPISGSVKFSVRSGVTPSTAPSAAASDEAPAAESPTTADDASRGPLVPLVIGVAVLGLAAVVFAARSLRR